MFNVSHEAATPAKEASGASYVGAAAIAACCVVVALVWLNDVAMLLCSGANAAK